MAFRAQIALLEVDGAGARLLSRYRNRFKHLDSLAAALAKRLRVTDAILDGEVICADETGRPIFIDLLRRKEPCFVAFDLLWLNGEDLRPLSLIERKKRLNRLLRRRLNHLIAEAMAVEGRGNALMAAVERHDLEGIVAKRKSDPYRRGVHWWKIKNRAYSQADDGRGELLNPHERAVRMWRSRTWAARATMARVVVDGRNPFLGGTLRIPITRAATRLPGTLHHRSCGRSCRPLSRWRAPRRLISLPKQQSLPC